MIDERGLFDDEEPSERDLADGGIVRSENEMDGKNGNLSRGFSQVWKSNYATVTGSQNTRPCKVDAPVFLYLHSEELFNSLKAKKEDRIPAAALARGTYQGKEDPGVFNPRSGAANLLLPSLQMRGEPFS